MSACEKLLLLCALVVTAWNDATRKVQKAPEGLLFPPAAFTHAPKHVRQRLEEMRCRIFKKTNLIEGRFASANQDDWAAMCVFDGKIQPVVLWGGKTQCDSRPSPARDYKELLSDPLHDANLGAADAKRIALLHDAVGGTEEVPPITHAGLEVGDEQASVIYYCREGKWIELTGDD